MMSQLFSRESVRALANDAVAHKNRTESRTIRAGDFMLLALDLTFVFALHTRDNFGCRRASERFLGDQAWCGIRRSAVRSDQPGTFSRSSLSQTVASESLGARQSPRGESEPPEPTFGPVGMAPRLNWLIWKNRNKNTSSHFLIVERS